MPIKKKYKIQIHHYDTRGWQNLGYSSSDFREMKNDFFRLTKNGVNNPTRLISVVIDKDKEVPYEVIKMIEPKQ